MTKRKSPMLRNAAERRRSERRRARKRELQHLRAQRNLRIEPLEQRRLLAVGPNLVEIEAGGRAIADDDVRHDAFNELLFRFDANDTIDPATLDGFQFDRAGENGVLGDDDDVVLTPGYAGIGESPNEVILRFAETLPDDVYGIHVEGSVTNMSGTPFNGGDDFDIEFTLDQGTKAISVVPQPIVRDPDTGELSQAEDQIVVHFNSNQLDATLVTKPALYRLADETTGDLLFPSEVLYSSDTNRATLVFDDALPEGTFHLRIGASEEPNDSQETASNVGTLFQRTEFQTYESPVQLDREGNPVHTPIEDNATAISRISVNDTFLVRDVNVEINMDHEWSPDLRVFLAGPGGDRVELIRDIGSDVLGGQIYGTKFEDIDEDGVQDEDEPGLEGWTIFIDDNRNSVLDPGERSTVTDSDGHYSFVNLQLGETYRVAEVPQPLWTQMAPTSGGREDLLRADFSDGAIQKLSVMADSQGGTPTEGTFSLQFGSRTTAPIEYVGANATTAAHIRAALHQVVDPGVDVQVNSPAGSPVVFRIAFSLRGIGTPVDHPVLRVTDVSLDRGDLVIETVGDDEGFTTSGPENEWHVSKGRAADAGHTSEDSFYFGSGETEAGGGSYLNDAAGTLSTPSIDLRGQRITGQVFLELNHLLGFEENFDSAEIDVVDMAGNATNVFSAATSTSGFEPLSLNLTPFVGQQIQVDFRFTSDSGITDEGWYVDDVRVSVERGVHEVTLSEAPLGGIAKDVDFGGTRGITLGPDGFGYEAFAMTPDFEDITETGQPTLQDFGGDGFAVQAGGVAEDEGNAVAVDAAGNIYVTGSFAGKTEFGEDDDVTTLTSAGNRDIFLAKYSSDGELLWAQNIGGTARDVGSDVEVDAAGNVYVTGHFGGTVDFDPGSETTELISNGGSEAFVAKYTADGELEWAGSFGAGEADAGNGLDLDADGNVVVTGYFSGEADFDVATLASAGDNDVFLVKLDPAGTPLWAQRYGGTSADRGEAVVHDSAGRIIVAGSFAETVDFDAGSGVLNLDSAGLSDAFVLSLTADGETNWVEQFGDLTSDVANAVAVDSSDNVLAVGSAVGDAIVRKYDAEGQLLWSHSFGGENADVVEDVAVDSNDAILLAGSYRKEVDFDPGPGEVIHASAGSRDIFMARFLADGELELVRVSGSSLDDVAAGIVVDADDNAISTGTFRQTIEIDLGPGVEPLTSEGNGDVFLAKQMFAEGMDDAAHPLTTNDLDGFEFEFYGELYDELFYSTNGLITFGSENLEGDNTDLTDRPPQATIAAFWEDMMTGGGDGEAVFWEVRGSGDDQRLIIQWNDVRLANPRAAGEEPLKFQAVLREYDNSIQFNYETVTGSLLFDEGADQQVGTFNVGQQDSPAVAANADGDYVVVWTTDYQDGDGLAVYGRMFNADGEPRGDEFQVNTTVAGNQGNAQVAMNADGRFVVVWDTDDTDIFAQMFDAEGNQVGGELQVATNPADTHLRPEVIIDDDGNFVVTWNGVGAEDDAGIHARGFDPDGAPLWAVDEIQRLEILGPPEADSTFRLRLSGEATEPITLVEADDSEALDGEAAATSIQEALRALPNTGDQITVTPIGTDEVQTITFTGEPESGAFKLDFDGSVTEPAIAFAGPDQAEETGQNIQNALRGLSNLGGQIMVEARGDYEYAVHFLGPDGSTDQPLLTVNDNSLNQGEIQIGEEVQGVAAEESLRFEIVFAGPDGGQDQLLLEHVNKSDGVTHLDIQEYVQGSNGEIRVNNYMPGVQELSRAAIDADGNFVVVWQSWDQDDSNFGIFAKRFDADGVAQPGDRDEQQWISLSELGDVGSTYQLGFDGETTSELVYTGDNVADARAIRLALRDLSNLSDDMGAVTVQPLAGVADAAEVQRIRFTGEDDNEGEFRLAHAGLITDEITFASEDGETTADNIQAALRALDNLSDGVTVEQAEEDSATEFLVTFGGEHAGIDQPLLFLAENNLDAGAATISDVTKGGHSSTDFIVSFSGPEGRRDQPTVTAVEGDVTIVTLVDGASSEFQVNEITIDSQTDPVVASNDAGQFMVAWQGPDQDKNGIYARLFDSDGGPLTSEFQVNTFTQEQQQQPAVIVTSEGTFVISWSSENQDGDERGIHARRFDATGDALDDEFPVNVLTIGDQYDADMAPLADGDFVVVWASEAGRGGIHARRFRGDEKPLDEGELQVSQFGTPFQDDPVVARNAAGDFVVAWVEHARDETLDPGVYVQAFEADGTPSTDELRASPTVSGAQEDPDVVIDELGNFVVTWRTAVEEEDGLVDSIQARRFVAAEGDWEDEFAVNTLLDGHEHGARIGMDASGAFTIAWEAEGTDLAPRGIVARRFEADGTPIDGSEFLVNTTALDAGAVGGPSTPAIDVNDAGEFVVVWDRYNSETDVKDLYARRFASGGTPLDAEDFLVYETVGNADYNQDHGDVSVAEDGSFVVVWQQFADDGLVGDVMGRRFDSGGAPADQAFVIRGDINESPNPRISMADDGIHVVTWTDNENGGIVGQRYAADGDLIGTMFVANDSAAGDQSFNSVSAGPMGTFLVGWLDSGQLGERVMVERFWTDNPSVGIKDEGPQTPTENLLQVWLDGSDNSFVGSGMSTRILVPEQVRQAMFAVDKDHDEIHRLDPDTTEILHSIPQPESIDGDAGLAFAGNTLYFVADGGETIYKVAPDTGAVVGTVPLAEMGIANSVNALAYLNGQLVAQSSSGDQLYFMDPFDDTLMQTIPTGASLVGGLAGAGARGTLFALESGGDILEIDPADGSVVNSFASPFATMTGLAFVEGYLWVGDTTGQISNVDPDTGAEITTWTTQITISALGGDGGGVLQQALEGRYRPFVGTILDDEADTPITAADGPFTGRFVPVEPLSHFDGISAYGSWTLEIEDTAAGDEGELLGWTLILNDPNDTPPDFQYTSNLGEDSPQGDNDIDLYHVDVMAGGMITIGVQPDTTLDAAVRVFDADGNQLGVTDAAELGGEELLQVELPEAGSYLIGVSSSANIGYSPLDGTGAENGTSSGSYRIEMSFEHPVESDDDNSSFDSATDFGLLGKAGQTTFAEIRNAPLPLNMPGSILEPGHRDIPAESHFGATSALGAAYAPEQLVVRFKAATDASQRQAILAGRDLSVVKDLSGILLVEGPSGMDVLAESRELASHEAVEYAEPDYLLRPDAIFPNDTQFLQLWGLNNIGQFEGTPDADIDAPEAWQATTGSSDIVIAVIDTGADYNHSDLAANIWVNPNEIAGDGIDNDGNGYVDDIHGIDTYNDDSDPIDGNDHGTHVAGTIAAVGNNGLGVTGVNWDAKIMPLKFLPDEGFGTTFDAIEAIDYMTMMKEEQGVNIVASNNSWGGGAHSNALIEAIQRSVDAGIVFVAAAGNDGLDNDRVPHFPASYDLDGIISVAATDPRDELAGFSNYGADSVDLGAPGVDIVSTTPGNTYAALNGTSMAAPHVTGVVGLLASVAPDASVQELKSAILTGADPIAALAETSVTGGRLNAAESLVMMGAGAPLTQNSVVTAEYNFQDFYGFLPSGEQPDNLIEEPQKERAREIFEIFSDLFGIEFVETEDQGLTVVTGDLRALDPTLEPGEGGLLSVSDGTLEGRVIMDAAEKWGINEYGGEWFQAAMREIAHSLGIGNTFDLPALTMTGYNIIAGAPPAEPVFPGDGDIIHGQFLFPPAANDVDLYKFDLAESGRLTAEIVAERMTPSSSLLDSTLALYRETTTADGPVREVIARNDDYYSSDSWLEMWLEVGTYYIAVTSTGNEGIDPATDDTGFGGTTEGDYELNLSFNADSALTLVDATAARTPFDGDSDGSPGGEFDFWFQSGPTIVVDKMNDTTAGSDGDGSLGNPYDTISAALADAASRLVVPAAGGTAFADGDSFTLTDGTNPAAVFEFDQDGVTSPGALPISFASAHSQAELADAIAAAINDTEELNVTAAVEGAVVQLDQLETLDVRGTAALLASSNLVRIVGNGGDDGAVGTLADNRPYLLGLDRADKPLADGSGVRVPQGVTVMIDAGALLKLTETNVDVGSSDLDANRAAGALQVLGTPDASVYFRSYHNDAVGGDSDGPGQVSQAGDWGGLVFREDASLAEKGIFLNWVNHADLNNGGGKVGIGSVDKTFTPIYLESARPTISHSAVRNSADAAISADPNSFEDSLGRIGPNIHDNVLVDNSINGLFVRIRTELGKALDSVDVSARWDDAGVVHVVSENLLIGGTPGGPILNSETGNYEPRLDARLRIDPGVVVKLQGARIEAEMGSQLIAEGTSEQPIILTSLRDDRFGGSGSFDTNNNLGETGPEPGQWGGLFFHAISKGSLDHVLLAHGGGLTPIPGELDRFAAIEVHQAEVRVTNSRLTDNEDGQSLTDRVGRGSNEAASIFVRGAQPILVNNSIQNNPAAPAISIDANSLEASLMSDWGRATGELHAYDQYADNHGPLVRMNLLDNNAVEGLVVRPAVLTTESVWDDTDIAHVLFGEIILLNHHTFSGLAFQSSDHESLVVKLGDSEAGFTANGQPLDIDDRIGGSIYALGKPGHPVVFTSLSDDSVTAGVALDGSPLGDTNNDGPSEGTPGDWRSVRLDQYSNDRNVEVVREQEPVQTGGDDVNAGPDDAQFLGIIAPDLKSGDADRRLGFEVRGFISSDDPSDVDVYSFDARGQTEIWIDIDRTGAALNAVVELIAEDGTVRASSYDNETLSGLADPLLKDAWRGPDFYTVDPDDPGMRVLLPGDPGTEQTYYVRVRSQPVEGEESNVDGGQSGGGYRLQLRLQQVDEIPGSTISNTEIKYATNGIEIIGMPAHSPLAGESGETPAANGDVNNAQAIGNLLTTDRNVLSVAGDLSAANDVDWYEFTLDYDLIGTLSGQDVASKTWSTIFDIDYADGLSRPNTTISVFDAAGNLVLVSRDSNVQDDLPGAGQGADTDDLSRGSFGKSDPFIGSVQMPAGVVPAGDTTTYYAAISSDAQLPEALNATFNAGSGNTLARLEPVNSVKRVVEDHIGFSGHTTGGGLSPVQPVQSLFDESALGDFFNSQALDTYVLPFTLGDAVLYVSMGNELWTVNPLTGAQETNVGDLSGGDDGVLDIDMRSDGQLFGVESLDGVDDTAGRLVSIDWADASETTVGNDAIPDYDPDTDPEDPNELTSDFVDALAYWRTGFDAAPTYDLYYAVRGRHAEETGDVSTLYRANPANGSAAGDVDPWGAIGDGIYRNNPGDVGRTTGMAVVESAGIKSLYGVSDTGMFYRISTDSGKATSVVGVGPSFAGLTSGPQNVEGGRYADLLFAVDTNGRLYALNTGGQLQDVFGEGRFSVQTELNGATGLAFSPADVNLWHPTMQRRAEDGHGINPAFDNSRPRLDSISHEVWSVDPFTDAVRSREFNEGEGGVSFYFGLEEWVENNENAYFSYNGNSQYGLLSAEAHQDLASNPEIAATYNVPGGTLGSLATNSFSLAGYAAGDKPTLYFNYFLESENANSSGDGMRDSFRLLVTANGGATWQLLATNNSVLSTAGQIAELPRFLSASANASTHPRQRVQELFDNTGWRQARVDLSEFAGFNDLQLRFDFSTAGTMNEGTPGDQFGDFTSAERAQANNFEGAYIDDIIIGFAERGEMITGPAGANDFFQVPQNPAPGAPGQVLSGQYQLEIRRGTEYGAQTCCKSPDLSVFRTFDTNDRMVRSLLRLGDENAERQQGQVRISSNTVRYASEYGILVDAGTRGPGDSPVPGSVRNLPSLNAERLVPGLTIHNNVVAESGVGGILYSGDANAGAAPLAVVPYAQLLNNTIYGGEEPSGVGIRVEENASPTLLNNIVANTQNGIVVDGSSGSTVLVANLFRSNMDDGTVGSDAIFVDPTEPLFVDEASGNFYPASGSRAIDSSINRLDDRPGMVAVTAPLGIPPRPAVAPQDDLYGQLRRDDPSQSPPPGLGSDIFKDRGAVERVDFDGPTATLILPEDNDDDGLDLDDALNYVLLEDFTVPRFRVRIEDEGIGLDDDSVVPSNVTLILNGTVLEVGNDYNFRFDPIGNVIELTMRSDIEPRRNVYEIVLSNDPETGIRDDADNPLLANQADGTVRFTIETAGPNDPPVANPESYVTDEDIPLIVAAPGVLENDTDLDFDVLSAVLVTGPENGTLTLNPDGSFEYQPDLNFNGIDSFTYLADDGQPESNESNEVTVTLTVNPVNDAPVAVEDSYSVDEDQTLTVAAPGVLENDTDVELDDLTATLVEGQGPSNGTLTLNTDGSFEYTPNPDFNGNDSFAYVANDGELDSNETTVTITVNPVNDPPVAVEDSYSVDEDVTLTVAAPGVLENDTDIDGDELMSLLVDGEGPSHGTVTLGADGSFEYVPDENYFGGDSFTYVSNDGELDSEKATVAITVMPVNDPPEAVDDSYEVDEDEELTVAAPGVLENDTDIDGDSLTAIRVSGPENGTLTLNDDGSFTYTPELNFNGEDAFSYVSNDGELDSNEATVTITVNPVNDPPEAVDDSYIIDEDQTLTILAPGVLGNDTDMEDDALKAVLASGPSHGQLTLNDDGSFTYTPELNFNGEDSFTYMANDGELNSNEATVTITVMPVNDAPEAVDDSYEVDEDEELTVAAPGVLENDTDVEGDSLTAIRVSGPENGTLTLNDDGSFTYTPELNFNGEDAFSYVANDGELDSNEATVTITVNPVNDPPVAVDDQYMVLPGESLVQDDADGTATPGDESDDGVQVNDMDVEGDELTVSLVDGPTQAETFQLNDDGTFTYTPRDDDVYIDTFTYRLFDGEDLSNVATVTLVFNAPPVAEDDQATLEIDRTKMIDVLANDYDPEGGLDRESIIIEANPAHGVAVVVEGQIEYTPNLGFLGTDSLSYSVADEFGLRSNVATVEIVPDPNPWQNSLQAEDVNGDGTVSPLDALLVIAFLNDPESPILPDPPTSVFAPPPYLDVSGDGAVTPKDALLVIGYLNGQNLVNGEGESTPRSQPASAPSLAEGEAAGSLLTNPAVAASASSDTPLSDDVTADTYQSEMVESRSETEIREGMAENSETLLTDSLANASSDLDSLLDDIAEDVAGAQDDELVNDLALSGMLRPKRYDS